MNSLSLALIFILIQSLSWAGGRICPAVFSSDSENAFQLITKDRYQELVETGDLDFKLDRKNTHRATHWRSESIGFIEAKPTEVFNRTSDLSKLLKDSAFLKVTSNSNALNELNIEFQVPVLGKFNQVVILTTDSKVKTINFDFQQGPFEGLSGKVQIIARNSRLAEMRSIFEADLPSKSIANFIPKSFLEKTSLLFLKESKSKLEQ